MFSLPIMHRLYASLITCSALLFSSLSSAEDLLTVVNLAQQNDQQYRAEIAEADANKQAKQLRSSRLKPQLSAFYTHQTTTSDITSEQPFPADTDNNPNTPDELIIISNTLEPEETANNWGVSAQQTLFDASAWQTAKQGRHEAKGADIQREQAEQNSLLRASQAYFYALRADNNLRVALAQNDADQWLLRQTEGRYDVGIVAPADLHQAQAAYDISSAQLLAAQAEVENARYSLSVLTGSHHKSLFALASGFKAHPISPNDSNYWRQQAAENNLAVLSANAAMKASKAAAKAGKYARLPTANVQLSYFDNDAETSGNSFPSYNNTASGSQISLNVSAPLYLGGSLSAQKRQAHARYNAAIERHKFAIRNSEQNTLIAFNNLNVASSRVKAQKQALTSATSAADSINAGYEAGVNTIIDLVGARRTQFAAERDLGNAKIDYVLRFLELKYSIGQLQKSDINNINNLLTPPKVK